MRILLVDDHVVVREGVAGILATAGDLQVVGQAGDGTEALRMARTLKPDLIMMDVSMPGGSGLEYARIIKAELPGIRVVMLTAAESDDTLAAAVKAGTDGFLLKSLSSRELISAVRAAGRGESPLTPALANRMFRIMSRREATRSERNNWEDLSPRELEVLRLVAKGLAYKEVAYQLKISENTVKNHIQNVIQKLDVDNRIQAVTLAVQQGLVDKGASEQEGKRG